MAELNVDRFLKRLQRLHSHFIKHNSTIWNSADSLWIHRGQLSEDDPYLKSALVHQWLFGYELPDTILALTKDGRLYLLGTKKKCDFVEPASKSLDKTKTIKEIHLLLRNKDDANAANYETLLKTAAAVDGSAKRTLGTLLKEEEANAASGGVLGPWEEVVSKSENATTVDISPALSLCMSVKDEDELDIMKKSSVLSNKVMKHGYVKKMEEVIDSEDAITHEALATYIDEIIEDPAKISLKVPKDDVQSCYFPIIQSGGNYDLRVSAQSTGDKLTHDVILVSIGARYKNYCSNIGRTFFVDPPKKVSELYETLLEMQEACLAAMKPGNQLKAVYKAAMDFLQDHPKHSYLVEHLPKNLGFCTGLDFRESALLLSPKSSAAFKRGMVFCLSVGFQNLDLPEGDRAASHEKSPVKQLSTYSLMVADMVSVTSESPDVMTKMGKNLTDVAYNINDEAEAEADDDDDDDEVEDEDDDDEDEPVSTKRDAKLARKLAKDQGAGTGRKSSRLASHQESQSEAHEGAAQREKKQIKLMARRNEDRLRELARKNRNKDGSDEKELAEELETYKRTRDYPDNVQPNQVKVDMENQCLLLPIGGVPVPFHISTVKNVVMPDADGATLLRLNFYTAGMAVGKDAPANMVKLVQKYAPYASFVRELTFRSLDGHNLTQAYRQILELRKRARMRELREQEEATLVEQEKLVRTKNERVPRLADLTMRPVLAGRKTQGNLEAHSNGMRFISTRNEVVDIMYSNIKYAIYQPCESEIMVLVHFHLKNSIMVGKKKHNDVQFYTEVVDASQAVDNSRRSMYDPDEMDDEQRERQLRKKLNQAFKDFCKKVDAVARKNGHELEFDIPYRDLGFTGNPHKEMVTIMPTLNCLVNLTETPFFVIDLDEVDHVHFERVTYMSKAFDIVLINKDFAKVPWHIDMIPMEDKDGIQEWLTDMEITYTAGPMNLNWKSIIATVKEDERFYMTTEEDEVTEKEAGWEFLRMYGREDDDDDEEDDDDSEFDEDKQVEEEGSAESEEEDFDEELDEDDDDEEDFDADEELEEQGMDWDEMLADAAEDDRRKRSRPEDEVALERRPKQRNTGQRSSGGGGQRPRSSGGQRPGSNGGQRPSSKGGQRPRGNGGQRPSSNGAQQKRRR